MSDDLGLEKVDKFIPNLEAAMKMAEANSLAIPDGGWAPLSGMWMVEELRKGNEAKDKELKSLKDQLADKEANFLNQITGQDLEIDRLNAEIKKLNSSTEYPDVSGHIDHCAAGDC